MDPKREKDRKSKKSISFLNVQAVREEGGWWFLCVASISGGKAAEENVRSTFSSFYNEKANGLRECSGSDKDGCLEMHLWRQHTFEMC